MANRKITELTALTGANATDTDVFAIVDVSADETKKMTLGELKEAFDSGSGFVRITGDTMTGDLTVPNVIVSGNVDGRDVSADGTKLDGIEAGADVTDTANVTAAGAAMETGAAFTGDVTFGDNDKAIFGAGSDLQIYHNSGDNSSRLIESGSGNFFIGGDNIYLSNSGISEFYLRAAENAGVTLYYDNLQKLNTTSTGIDVTGTVTADGLTVAGSTGSVATVRLQAEELHADIVSVNEGVNYGGVKIQTNSNGTLKDRLKIESNGDISFYEDTGTTPKFFWDASAESLGLNGAPSAWSNFNVIEFANDVYVGSFTGGAIAGYLGTNNYYNGTNFIYSNSSYATRYQQVDGTHQFFTAPSGTAGNAITFSESMRIDSSGNVGIGTSSPSYKLDLTSYYDGYARQWVSSSAFVSSADGSNGFQVRNLGSGTTGIKFSNYANNAEWMRLDSSGNLLVGTTDADPNNNSANTSADDGFAVTSNVLRVAKYNDNAAVFNRTGSDGGILQFRKSGSPVGSIGSSNSGYNLFITTSDTGLAFNYLADEIVPCTANGAYRTAAVDLGDANARFKDLYLSGGVYLGGTGAANKLDDYEEGTWTPAWQTSNGDLSSFSNNGQIGTYTKIGNAVRVFFQLATANAASMTGTGNIIITGLPFSVDDVSNSGVPVMVKTHDSRFVNDPYGVAEIQSNATQIKLFKTQAMNTANALTVSDMAKTNAGNYNLISGTCVYKTSA